MSKTRTNAPMLRRVPGNTNKITKMCCKNLHMAESHRYPNTKPRITERILSTSNRIAHKVLLKTQ